MSDACDQQRDATASYFEGTAPPDGVGQTPISANLSRLDLKANLPEAWVVSASPTIHAIKSFVRGTKPASPTSHLSFSSGVDLAIAGFSRER